MPNIGWPQILIIVGVVVLFILIPKKLPQLGRSLGMSIRGFKKGRKEGKEEGGNTVDEAGQAAGGDELKSTVSETRDPADSKGVVPNGKDRSGGTSPGAADRKRRK